MRDELALERGTERAESRPRVAVLALIEDGAQGCVGELLSDVRAQQGVEAELVLVDRTTRGLAGVTGATIVRCTAPARRRAWLAGAAATNAPWIAWAKAGARFRPGHLARACAELAARPERALSLCDSYQSDAQGQLVARTSPSGMGEIPGPYWEAGVLLRRSALEELLGWAFYPVELELYQRLRRAERVSYVSEPGFVVERSLHERACSLHLEDGRLLAGGEPCPEPPLLSVSLCARRQATLLRRSLEGWARQLVQRGTFEIVLVDDGSSAEVSELLEGLELGLPLRLLRQPAISLAEGRNLALQEQRGELVLLARDDVVPAADCVEAHLRQHARLGPGARAIVIGTCDAPTGSRGAALVALERSRAAHLDPAHAAPEGSLAALAFAAGNTSLPLALLRELGGYDPSFVEAGGEEYDMALRLAAAGCDLQLRPEARARRCDEIDLAELRRRRGEGARSELLFLRKHPQALASWMESVPTAAELQRQEAECAAETDRLERAAEQIWRLDLGLVDCLRDDFAAFAETCRKTLVEWLPRLERSWWRRGTLAGLREQRGASLTELQEAGYEPYPLATENPRRVLAWPRWRDARSLERLMEHVEPLAADGFATLVLLHQAELDGERELALEALAAAYAGRFGEAGSLEVLIEDRALERAERLRLGRSVQAWVELGGEPPELLETIVAERLRSRAEVVAWRARRSPLVRAPAKRLAARFGQTIELSVIVPTHDRPRELANLMVCLGAQTLDPARYEVIVVDDGSELPASEVLSALAPRHALTIVRQDARGPGTARNRALALARGEHLLYLNDDALPARHNLAAHLAALRARREPIAVLGPFTLIAERRQDSFADYVESSTALFAQPEMRAGALYHGLAFCTGNISIARAHVEAVGGFDESFRYAGGEDSELGLRLERMLGLRVLYEPHATCGHDHDLDIEGLYRRQRVLGWAAHKIQDKHEDATLVAGWPLASEAWEELRREQRQAAAELAMLLRELGAIADQERAQKRPRQLQTLRSAFEAVRENGFREGLLLAHDGVMP